MGFFDSLFGKTKKRKKKCVGCKHRKLGRRTRKKVTSARKTHAVSVTQAERRQSEVPASVRAQLLNYANEESIARHGDTRATKRIYLRAIAGYLEG
jgi:hypothetical protein